ncbi:hypothetical protein RvY_03628 [Ramazzottius varieornatus]|uniref:Uncharacterized protein n=1 Tax=Ramazzottius varieornatus TaxID=947166 RepID=A0A1D1UPI6_RAMVA|nr:hypothetical protein RvY_03628 [Ramazzottius varieornatus]
MTIAFDVVFSRRAQKTGQLSTVQDLLNIILLALTVSIGHTRWQRKLLSLQFFLSSVQLKISPLSHIEAERQINDGKLQQKKVIVVDTN